MCVSRFQRVVAGAGEGWVLVTDSHGATRKVSLLALAGPPPGPGDWLVVHSGYALERVDRDAAEAVALEIDGVTGTEGRP